MSTQPLDELRRLLATEAPTRGRVVRVLSGRVQVATSQGLATYQTGGALRVGLLAPMTAKKGRRS